jgi:thioredoxin reductase
MPRNEPRIAILGAGPIGLEAAVLARSQKLAVTVYERGRIAEHWLRWGHVRLFSPFGSNVTGAGRNAILVDNSRHAFPADGDIITGREHVAQYLEPLAKCRLLADCVRTETQVLRVGRQGLLKSEARKNDHPFRLLVREAKGRERIEEADIVLDCTGTYGQHRWLGEGGIPAVGELAVESQIIYSLEDVLGERRGYFAGKTIFVYGGGHSAATTVCQLATLAEQNQETWVIWAARGNSSQPIRRLANDPLKERDRLAVRANTYATRSDGNVEFHPQTVIDAVEITVDKGFKLSARVAGKPRTWDVERIVANVGSTPDIDLYRELQIQHDPVTLAPIQPVLRPQATGTVGQTFEPNYFVLGAKSFGRNSQFLLRTGFDQIRDVFTLITGKKVSAS